MKTKFPLVVLHFTVLMIISACQNNNNNETRLNDIQVIGSHNSYKIAIDKPLLDYLAKENPSIRTLEYEHIPLTEQLDLGLRNLELDVFYDPEGWYYNNPKGLEVMKSLGKKPQAFDSLQKLNTPGLKVFHVQDIDFRSHQLIFTEALEELKRWSQANSGHTPITITINAKDGKIPNTKDPLPFTADALKSIDNEIKQVMDSESLITPDLVMGSYETLEQAVLAEGWPLLEDVKNRFLFVLDEKGAKKDRYLSNFSSLREAVLFVNEKEGNPNAGFLIMNDPINDFEHIKTLVSLGYMVRTRADSGTEEARENDYSTFDKAKASGAQIITTDYYIPSKLFKSDYKVIFENNTYEKL